MAEHKGYEPTIRRREEARKQGNILKSQLLSANIGALMCFAFIKVFAPATWVANKMLLEYVITRGYEHPQALLLPLGRLLATTVCAVLLVAASVSLLVEVLQVGVRFQFGLLGAKTERLDPLNGFKRIFAGARDFWQPLLRVGGFLIFLYWALHKLLEQLKTPTLYSWPAVLKTCMDLLWISLVVLVVYGAVDYVFRRRSYLRELSMSRDDLRREHKDNEGDPMLKGVRKQLHESVLLHDIVARVRRSKVIVVERR